MTYDECIFRIIDYAECHVRRVHGDGFLGENEKRDHRETLRAISVLKTMMAMKNLADSDIDKIQRVVGVAYATRRGGEHFGGTVDD